DRQLVFQRVKQREGRLPRGVGAGRVERHEDLEARRHGAPAEAQQGDLLRDLRGDGRLQLGRGAKDLSGGAGELAGVQEVAAVHSVSWIIGSSCRVLRSTARTMVRS